LDRREFLRRLIIASALGVTAVSGVAVLAEKVLSSQTTTSNTLPLPTISTQETTSVQSTTIESTTDSTTDPSITTSKSGSTTQSKSSTTSKTTNRTTTSTQTSSSSSVPNGYILLAPLSAVNGKTYAYFSHPSFGSSILVNYNGTWKAFSAVCTHAGCTLNYSSTSITCPCHPGVFSAANGSVVSGPPPSKIAEYDVKIINNNLYVGNTVIN